jgi:hypothetical protein
VLTKGGDVYTWGTYKDSNGHIGFKIGNDDELVFKQQLPDLMEEMVGKDVVQLASGSDFTLALTKDGANAAPCSFVVVPGLLIQLMCVSAWVRGHVVPNQVRYTDGGTPRTPISELPSRKTRQKSASVCGRLVQSK